MKHQIDTTNKPKHPQTAEIFKRLRQGKFICSNSPDVEVRRLYDYLDNEANFERLYDYFLDIDYVLSMGEEFFYFARLNPPKDELSRKLEQAFDWIDWLDFFKAYDSAFDVGHRFSPSDIDGQLKNNADLKHKLERLRLGKDAKTYAARIEKLIKRGVDENFIALESELTQTYKVLTAFNYLKDLINAINLPEDEEDDNATSE